LKSRFAVDETSTNEIPASELPIAGVAVTLMSGGQFRESVRVAGAIPVDAGTLATSVSGRPGCTTGCGPAGSTQKKLPLVLGTGTSATPFNVTVVVAGVPNAVLPPLGCEYVTTT
jgi:hypothetical protein